MLLKSLLGSFLFSNTEMRATEIPQNTGVVASGNYQMQEFMLASWRILTAVTKDIRIAF